MKHPEVLYHYTSGEGLLNILNSGHIWASDAAYMNDPGELRYGFDLLADLAKTASSDGKLSKSILKNLLNEINQVVEEKTANGRVYFVSFCEDGDLLSQWRGYGASGGGYAIGVDPTCLYGPSKHEKEPERVLTQVLYDRAKQVKWLSSWLNEYISGNPTVDLLYLFSDILMALKHPSYAEEREWRLVQFGRYVVPPGGKPPKNEIIWPASFRVRSGRIVPYGDLDLTKSTGPLKGKFPAVEIVCGPTIKRDLGLKALAQFGTSRGFNCRVDGKASPYERKGRPILNLRLSSAPFAT